MRDMYKFLAWGSALLALAAVANAQALQTSAFTYQGELKQFGLPVTGPQNFKFRMYDALSGGSQVGAQITLNGIDVEDGLFTVLLNEAQEFGPTAFNGARRWLEIEVSNTILSPRQEISAAPYALGPWQSNGTSLTYTGGNVGIGTTNPVARIDVNSGASSYLRMDSAFGDLHFNGGTDGIMSFFNEGPSTGRTTFISQGVERFTISNTGRVGIATMSPTSALEVAGVVKADDYEYRSPKTLTVNVADCEFHSRFGEVVYCGRGVGGAYVDSTGPGGGLQAVAHLPDGALITQLTFHYYDNSNSSDIFFSASALQFSGTGFFSLNPTGISAGASSSIRSSTFSLPFPYLVDNSREAITVLAGPTPTWDHERVAIVGAVITYTISNPR